jgi:uncharacterized membrane protein HdeD (DUF308 family)
MSATTTMHADADHAIPFEAISRLWWIFLVIGGAWMLFAISVFRFSWSSVSAISILFGIAVIAMAFEEVIVAFSENRSGWARVGRLLLAVAFLVIGVIAFVHPGNTFAALAGVMSFYFVFMGTFRIVSAIDSSNATLWSFEFLLGIAEILIGFWAAGDFGRRSVLLVVWVGVAALTRGISALVFAFELRGAHPSPASSAGPI